MFPVKDKPELKRLAVFRADVFGVSATNSGRELACNQSVSSRLRGVDKMPASAMVSSSPDRPPRPDLRVASGT